MTLLEAYERSDSRGSWFVLADGENLPDADESGRWIKTTEPVDIEQ